MKLEEKFNGDDEFIYEKSNESEDNSEDSEQDFSDQESDEQESDEQEFDEPDEQDELLPKPKYGDFPDPKQREDVISLPVMEDFTPQELDLLPLSFFKGPVEQWGYILEAIDSNFSQVRNLPMVNDKTLQLAADAAMLYVLKNIKQNQVFNAKNFPKQYYLYNYYQQRTL